MIQSFGRIHWGEPPVNPELGPESFALLSSDASQWPLLVEARQKRSQGSKKMLLKPKSL